MALKVVVGPVFSEAGGVSRHIDAIARHSSHSVSKSPSPLTRAAIGSRSKGPMYEAYTRLRAPFGLWGYDILHSHAHPWFTRLCRRSRPRASGWVHTYHAFYFPQDYPSGALEPWQQDANEAAFKVAKDSDVRICVSRYLTDHLSSEHGLDSLYIPNGVDLAECARADGDRFRRAHGLSDFVLFVGSGLAFSAMMPSLLALASVILSRQVMGAALGLVATSAGLGGVLLPSFASRLAGSVGLDRAFVIVVGTAALAACGFALLHGRFLRAESAAFRREER